MVRICLVCSLIGGWISSISQPVDRPEEALMSYLEQWTNVGIERHQRVEAYNQDLVAYLEGSLTAVPRMTPVSSGPANAPFAQLSTLTAPAKTEVMLRLERYHALALRLDEITTRLMRYSERGAVRKDSGQQAFDLMRQLQLYHEDTRSIQNELLFWLVRSLPYGTPDGRNQPAARLAAVVTYGRVLLFATATDLVPRIERTRKELALAIEAAMSSLATLSPEKAGLYLKALESAQRMNRAAAGFVSGDPSPPPYDAFPRTYYTFNYGLNDAYSGADGLVARHNQWAKLYGPAALSLTVGELPRIEVLTPDWPETVVHKPADFTEAVAQNLVFLVDVSGSMTKPERLPLFQEAAGDLVAALRPQDFLSLVTFAGESRVVLPATSGNERGAILAALRRLSGEGKTRIHAGFLAGYGEARRHLTEPGNDRLILLTDGGFDITRALLRDIEAQREKGIGLTVLYVGPVDEDMTYRLERLAQVGGGRCVHLKPEQAANQMIFAVQAEE